MKRTCFVHIGMHKSGSTAIQTAFDGYDDGKTKMLRLPQPNHSSYMLMLFSCLEMQEWSARQLKIPKEKLKEHIRSNFDSIIAQFQSDKANYVISGEGLSIGLRAAEIVNLKAFLLAWFDDIQIIIYLRDPASYMRSAFQETAKMEAVNFDFDNARPHYRLRTFDWIEVFGRENVSVVLYDRKAFVQGSVVHDFAHRIGADVSRVVRQTGNESLRAEGFALTYAIRNMLAVGKLPRMRQAQMRADLYMAPKYGRRDFDFSDELFTAELEKQKDDIAWAEGLMQRPFPVQERSANAVVFGSHEDIMRYADQCRAGFDRWKRTNFSLIRRLRYLVRVLRRGIL
jgi:hypothetical protein